MLIQPHPGIPVGRGVFLLLPGQAGFLVCRRFADARCVLRMLLLHWQLHAPLKMIGSPRRPVPSGVNKQSAPVFVKSVISARQPTRCHPSS